MHVPTHWEKPSFQENIKFCLAILVTGPKSLCLAFWAVDLFFPIFGNEPLHHRSQRQVSFQRGEAEAQGRDNLLSTFLHPNTFEKPALLAEQICSWCTALSLHCDPYLLEKESLTVWKFNCFPVVVSGGKGQALATVSSSIPCVPNPSSRSLLVGGSEAEGTVSFLSQTMLIL